MNNENLHFPDTLISNTGDLALKKRAVNFVEGLELKNGNGSLVLLAVMGIVFILKLCIKTNLISNI